MSVTDQVEAYVAGLAGAAACDRCIGSALAPRAPWHANLAARRLACIGAVHRQRGRCDGCGAHKLVTSIRPSARHTPG